MLGTAALVSILGVLVLMAVFHALVVQGQRELDRVNADIDAAGRVNDGLQLELAQMEAPERIVAAARSYGMVDAPEVVYLTPKTTDPEVVEQ
jgi:cell division protein FtsL